MDAGGKGKLRAHDDDDGRERTARGAAINTIARIAASASGLTRSAFATPDSNELNQHAAAGKGQAEQPSSSSSSQSAWAEFKATQQQIRQANPPAAFRNGHTRGAYEAV